MYSSTASVGKPASKDTQSSTYFLQWTEPC
jgi:hypothetical protein